MMVGISLGILGFWQMSDEGDAVIPHPHTRLDIKNRDYLNKKIEELEQLLHQKSEEGSVSTVSVPSLDAQNAVMEELRRVKVDNERLRLEQQEMRQTLAVTNRLITELEFRVETHSKSFRPLKVERPKNRDARPPSNGGRVLPPISR